jgi:N-acetylglucosamine-6-sulfatase
VAPTVLDLAGAPVPAKVQGRSLRPLLTGKSTTWRTSFFYEYFREDWLPGIPSMVAIRTDRWKYIRYPDIDDVDELYDLSRDPNEMRNLAIDPAASGKLSEMRAELDRLMSSAR